jgi:hypothetical protein
MFSLRAEGFSCSLGILYGGVGISKLHFDQENKNCISSCTFFQVLGHQTLDPDPDQVIKPWIRIRNPDQVIKPWIRIRNPDPQLEKMLDPDPH